MNDYPTQQEQDRTSLRRILIWIGLALILGLGSLIVGEAQELPETPKPHSDRLEWSLLAADASSRALDCYSTQRMLDRGWHEIILPKAVASHPALMAGYSAATVAADWMVSRRLERGGHRQLARLVTMVDIGQDAPFAIHNLFLGKRTVLPSLPPGRLGTR